MTKLKVFTITYYTILRSLRDTKSLINTLLLPIVLILILGNALGNAFKIQDIDKTMIGYLNQDKGQYSKQFEGFLSMDGVKDYLEVINVSSYEEGVEKVKKGELSGFILVESGYSAEIQKGTKGTIKVFSDNESSFRASILKNLVDSYVSGANATYAAYKLGNSNPAYNTGDMLERVPISAKGKIPRAIDYYAVTMLVMIIMYGAQDGLHGIARDYIDTMRIRLGSTPVSMTSHFTGKILGLMVMVFLQSLVLIAFAKYAFGAYWGNNLPAILFVSATLSVFAVALGVMIAMVAKDRNAGAAALSTVIPIMTFVSGGYVKIASDDKVYNAVKLLLPSNLGQTAFFSTIYGENAAQAYFSLAVLWGLIVVIGMITVLAGRRKFV